MKTLTEAIEYLENYDGDDGFQGFKEVGIIIKAAKAFAHILPAINIAELQNTDSFLTHIQRRDLMLAALIEAYREYQT